MRSIVLSLSIAAMCWGQCPSKVLIVTGNSDEPYHHWRETTKSLHDILTAAGRYEVFVTEEPRGLTSEALVGYQALVWNYNGPRLPHTAEQAVESFVKNGGGLFAFHLAAYGTFFGMKFENGHWVDGTDGWKEWPEIIGMRWTAKDLGHAPRGPFEVRRETGQSFLANDELYHKITLLSGVTVQATAQSPVTKREEPIAWTNRYGNGRAFFTTLGHDQMAFHQPGMQFGMIEGLDWATSGGCMGRPPVPKPIRLLVVTGGHSYPTEFYAMLDSLSGVKWTHVASQAEAFASSLVNKYDAILLHDMLSVTDAKMRDNLKEFVEAGKGIVSIHHSIVDYADWPWWNQEVTGGRYYVKAEGDHAASKYREGVDYIAAPVAAKKNHPVLAGVTALTAHDEVYSGMWQSPKIEVLMETIHPEQDRPVVYVGPNEKARVVYIQLGHSASTMENPGFRRLVRNAVEWVARRNQ